MHNDIGYYTRVVNGSYHVAYLLHVRRLKENLFHRMLTSAIAAEFETTSTSIHRCWLRLSNQVEFDFYELMDLCRLSVKTQNIIIIIIIETPI